MRNISLDEAEARLRSLVAEAAGGQRFTIVTDMIPQARLLPPKRRDDGRDLDFLALKRHLAACGGAGRPRLWRRADVYRRKAS